MWKLIDQSMKTYCRNWEEKKEGGTPKGNNQEIIPKNSPVLKDMSCQIEKA